MTSLFIAAVALVLIFEGCLPFLNPALWRKTLSQAMQLPDSVLRKIGLSSMLIGAGILYLL